jgi:glycosyltransferase involved in cell wall biosynthesis
MLAPSQAIVPGSGRRLRILAGAPFVPWPATTYSNQVVLAKLAALARRHEVVFLCGVATSADRAGLQELAADTGIVVHGVPAPNSGGQTARLTAHLGGVGHGLASGVPIQVFKAGNVPLRRSLAALAGSGDFDLVHTDYWYVARDWIHQCPIPSVCYVHDLMFERVSRGLAFGRPAVAGRVRAASFSRGLRRAELRTLAGFDGLAAISPREADVLAAALPRVRVAALPAGVDTARLRSVAEVAAEPHSVLFVGALASGPNEDAAWAFARHVWPRVRARDAEARLYIVGRAPSARLRAFSGRDGIMVEGDVPEVLPWYERCAVVVSPLRWGSGMKGKVLEAMALGRPLVASSVSVEGIAAAAGEHYLAADTPPEFATAVTRLLADPAEGARLTLAARRLVEERYEREACLADFLAFVQEVADA